jgi:hypothetical protein
LRKAVALLALVALAGVGAVVALGQGSGSSQRLDETTVAETEAMSSGSTVSSSVVVRNSSSCSVSVTSVNGVTTTTRSGDCSTSSACSLSVSSVNGVTTTTKSGDCVDTTTTTTSGNTADLDLVRALIANLLVWFRFAAGM